MTASIDILDSDIYTKLREYLLDLFPGTEVIRTLDNNVPLPRRGFISMSIIKRARMATPTHRYDDVTEELKSITPTMLDLQLDFVGVESWEWAQIFAGTVTDYPAWDKFNDKIKPLYCSDALQVPLLDAERDYQKRFRVVLSIEYLPTITTAQDFFNSANVVPINSDVFI